MYTTGSSLTSLSTPEFIPQISQVNVFFSFKLMGSKQMKKNIKMCRQSHFSSRVCEFESFAIVFFQLMSLKSSSLEFTQIYFKDKSKNTLIHTYSWRYMLQIHTLKKQTHTRPFESITLQLIKYYYERFLTRKPMVKLI